MKNTHIKNLIDGIDIEFDLNKLFNDIRPSKIIVYKNTFSGYPKTDFLIQNIMKKFGFSISFGEFDDKGVTYESKILTCLSSKKEIKKN